MRDNLSTSYGHIDDRLGLGTFLESVLAFVNDQLAIWRDRPGRRPEDAEGLLNSQLCKHLNNAARREWLPYSFHHEEPQGGERRADMSAGFVVDRFLEGTYYSEDDPFLVFECKRLPPPRRAREREYVTSRPADKIMGGIQRFKLGLHGGRLRYAVMIGYIQRESPDWWFKRINAWISELEGATGLHGEVWSNSDALVDLEYSGPITAKAKSRHIRTGRVLSDSIEIRHFWVVMKS